MNSSATWSASTIPSELIGRIIDSLRVDDREQALTIACAACVCRTWNAEAASTWRSRATRTLPTESAGLIEVAPEFSQAGTLDAADWSSTAVTLRLNPSAPSPTPAAWRDLCRAYCAARESSLVSFDGLFSHEIAGFVPAAREGGSKGLVSFFGAGRLGSGFSQDVHLVLKSLQPEAWLECSAMAVVDALLEAFATRLRVELLASVEEGRVSFDALMRAVELLLPAELARAAASEIESATAHMGHTPDARTQRACLFGSSASAAPFAGGCEPVMMEIMRLLEFLCVDLLVLAWEAHSRAAKAQPPAQAAAPAQQPEAADDGGSGSAPDPSSSAAPRAPPRTGVIRLSSLVEALRDDAWAALCADLFVEPQTQTQPSSSADASSTPPSDAGVGGATWVAAAVAAAAAGAPPLGCASVTGACFVPLPMGALDAAARVEQAHARYVGGASSSSSSSGGGGATGRCFDLEDVSIPLSLPLARAIVARLEAWGASRVAFVRLSPDCDSNQLFPSFIAAQLPGPTLAGVAFVHILQD